MAQSRLSKAASIFTRLNGLVKSGLIPWNERPLWYDIYKTFPPDRDPSYRSVLGNDEIPPLPPKIFYAEDELRAYYFKNTTLRELIVLNSNILKPVSELFIQEYVELSKKGVSEENLIEATLESMNKKGYPIKKLQKDSVVQDDLNLDEELSKVFANLNKNEVIQTKPDEHDKNTSTSLPPTSSATSTSQKDNSTITNDKNQK